jgi:hypothetical protein
MLLVKRIFTLLFLLFFIFSCKKDSNQDKGKIQLSDVSVGGISLSLQETKTDIPTEQVILIAFSSPLDTSNAASQIKLIKPDQTQHTFSAHFINNAKTIEVHPSAPLVNSTTYTLSIGSGIHGNAGEGFPGVSYTFTTEAGKLEIKTITLNGLDFSKSNRNANIEYTHIKFDITFSHELNPGTYKSYFHITSFPSTSLSISTDNKTVTLINTADLEGYTRYYLAIPSDLTSKDGFPFEGYYNSFYTRVDSSLKFPLISDDQLLTLIQQKTFTYFYNFAHPSCGMARERNTSGDIVTTGGSGFGVMALIVGMDRNFITRTEGLDRLDKILNFLETCDRYHGAWPHWLNGSTGKTIPFSTKDDGGDLVETSFMIQGLLAMRQYLNPAISQEQSLAERITQLYNEVEYDWYTKGGENVLYWHWSPKYGWAMNFRLEGYNETLITYILAAASTTHTISAAAYHLGFARNGGIVNGKSFLGYVLPVGYDFGGPMFFAHYSFLGLDPRNLSDNYANYWTQNVNHSLINWAYCTSNPKKFPNYNASCWGLTASDLPDGYGVSEPTNDRGVIAPTAAISSLPYTPEQSMNAIRHFYYILGDRLWGNYGFYDAFDVSSGWWGDSYIAIDQGPEICMIENYRTALLWSLFMSSPEVGTGLTKLGFTY